MMRKGFLLCMIALCLVASDSPKNSRGCQEIFNPNGWSLPKKELFRLDESQATVVPGLPYEVTAEKWRPKNGSEKLSTNLPLYPEAELSPVGPISSDEVLLLTAYKTTDGRMICYLCQRVLKYASGLYNNVVESYVCDLDGDGSYESQFPVESESEKTETLGSIARIKLGQSEEDWLVNKMIRSLLCQLREGAK